MNVCYYLNMSPSLYVDELELTLDTISLHARTRHFSFYSKEPKKLCIINDPNSKGKIILNVLNYDLGARSTTNSG